MDNATIEIKDDKGERIKLFFNAPKDLQLILLALNQGLGMLEEVKTKAC